MFIKNMFRKAGYDIRKLKGPPLWPVPQDVEVIDDPFLLLLTPPNSGSTAIATFLGQMDAIATLHDRKYEGQFLVRGLREADRWWPEKYVDYKSVAGVWKTRIDALRSERDFTYILEKSPPNLVRYKALLRILPNTRVVVNNREPYANIVSQLHRYYTGPDAELRRVDAIRFLAEQWLYRSRMLRAACVDDGYPVVTYEAFCANPMAIVQAFGLDETGLSGSHKVKVKDYDAQEIRNMNAEQIGMLSPKDIGEISEILARAPDLVGFFGYEVR